MKGPREEEEEEEERGRENKTLPRVMDRQPSITHITWMRTNAT